MKKLIAQIVKFGVVGAIAFLIDWGLLNLILIMGRFVLGEGVANQELYTTVANTISFSVSLIFNYVASMKFVFTHKEDMNRKKEFIIFVVLSIIGLLINNFVVDLFAFRIAWPFEIDQLLKSNIGKIIATAVVMVWNFVTRKILLDAGDKENSSNESAFTNSENASEQSEIDE